MTGIDVMTGTKIAHPMLNIIVEGNIGCGKTTFIQYFAKNFPRIVFPYLEPVEKWRDVRGHNLFALMYHDPKSWSLAFQQFVQLTMIKIHSAQPNHDENSGLELNSVKLMERSLFSARHCFVENLSRNGLMKDEEMVVYDEWFKWLTRDVKVDLTIYLRASPDTCINRIKSRSRTEESQISKAYLETLHSLHDDWLIGEGGISKRPSPVMVIPADGSREEMLQRFERITPYILGDKEWSPDVNIFADQPTMDHNLNPVFKTRS